MTADLFVSLYCKGSDGVLGLGCDGGLSGEVLEDLDGLGELIS